MIDEQPTVTDYILMPDDYGKRDGQSTRSVAYFELPARVHGDIWISRIDYQLAEAIFDARNLLDAQSSTDNGETLTLVNTTRRSVRGGISLRF